MGLSGLIGMIRIVSQRGTNKTIVFGDNFKVKIFNRINYRKYFNGKLVICDVDCRITGIVRM